MCERATKKREYTMISQELTIEGMSCQHCVMTLKKELSKLEKLNLLEIQIGRASVEYEAGQVTEEEIRAAVEAAGYVLIP
jgi:copper chaperone